MNSFTPRYNGAIDLFTYAMDERMESEGPLVTHIRQRTILFVKGVLELLVLIGMSHDKKKQKERQAKGA